MTSNTEVLGETSKTKCNRQNGTKKKQDKNCKTCDSNPATWESKIVCLYNPFCDGRTNILERRHTEKVTHYKMVVYVI